MDAYMIKLIRLNKSNVYIWFTFINNVLIIILIKEITIYWNTLDISWSVSIHLIVRIVYNMYVTSTICPTVCTVNLSRAFTSWRTQLIRSLLSCIWCAIRVRDVHSSYWR